MKSPPIPSFRAIVAVALTACVFASPAASRADPSGGPASGTSPSFIVARQVRAEVGAVDRAAAALRLRTEAGRLSLTGPGVAGISLNPGDFVIVDLRVIKSLGSAPPPRWNEDDEPALIRQRVRGSIVAIQRALGLITVSSSAGRLTFNLPTAAVAGLRTGDSVLLDVAVRTEADVAAFAGDASRRKQGLAGLLMTIFGRRK
jgi:hypothetical protein